MFQTQHQTREGRVMLVGQMSTSHLLNTLNLRVKKAEEARQALDAIVNQEKVTAGVNGDVWKEVTRQMYGLPKPLNVSQATAQFATGMNELATRLAPYLMELWLRLPAMGDGEQQRLLDLAERWATAVGRSSPLPYGETVLMLAGDEDEDEGPDRNHGWGNRMPIDAEDIPF